MKPARRLGRSALVAHRSSLAASCVLAGFLVFLLAFLIAPVTAQVSGTDQSSGTVYQAPMFKFYVWGQVQSPGAYRLSANPDIVELLSAGGGPTEKADLSHVTLVRGIDQRRQTLNLRRLLNSGQTTTLSPGDVVIVPESFWYRFRDEITIVTSLAVFVNLYFTIANRPSQTANASRR